MTEIEEATAKLRALIREAHETIQASRDERKNLEKAKAEYLAMVNVNANETLKEYLDEASNAILEFQKMVEQKLGKRFDDLIEGPLADLENLIRDLHKVHTVVPMNQMAELPKSPLFKR